MGHKGHPWEGPGGEPTWVPRAQPTPVTAKAEGWASALRTTVTQNLICARCSLITAKTLEPRLVPVLGCPFVKVLLANCGSWRLPMTAKAFEARNALAGLFCTPKKQRGGVPARGAGRAPPT